jgi:hypothetical protein
VQSNDQIRNSLFLEALRIRWRGGSSKNYPFEAIVLPVSANRMFTTPERRLVKRAGKKGALVQIRHESRNVRLTVNGDFPVVSELWTRSCNLCFGYSLNEFNGKGALSNNATPANQH